MHIVRLLLNSFRVRLVVAIGLVVAMALAIVLISLPRQLDGYFAQQDRENLKARTEAMAALVRNQIVTVTTLGALPLPVLQEDPFQASFAVIDALEESGFVRDLTPTVALADVDLSIAPARGEPSAYGLSYRLDDSRGKPGQTREALTERSTFLVPASASMKSASITER